MRYRLTDTSHHVKLSLVNAQRAAGSAGSLHGPYALKLATRPGAGHIAVSIKCATWRYRGPIRLEAYFSFKPEAADLLFSELDVRAFGVLLDIQDAEYRWMPHFRHLAATGWEDVPQGRQLLCYNEIPTKYNWHYLRVDLDLSARAIKRLQCSDRVLALEGVEPMMIPAMANLWCMLNVAWWVETDVDKRAFLYFDSVVFSGDWP